MKREREGLAPRNDFDSGDRRYRCLRAQINDAAAVGVRLFRITRSFNRSGRRKGHLKVPHKKIDAPLSEGGRKRPARRDALLMHVHKRNLTAGFRRRLPSWPLVSLRPRVLRLPRLPHISRFLFRFIAHEFEATLSDQRMPSGALSSCLFHYAAVGA